MTPRHSSFVIRHFAKIAYSAFSRRPRPKTAARLKARFAAFRDALASVIAPAILESHSPAKPVFPCRAAFRPLLTGSHPFPQAWSTTSTLSTTSI